MSRDVVLGLTDVTKIYSTTPPVAALGGVTFDIERGELVGVVGPSGSGKSTLLHIMGTLDLPTSGKLHIDGYDVANLSDKQLSALRSRSIGFVFQQFHLLSGFSALDNVADGLLYTGAPLRQRRRLAVEALERVGLGNRLDHVATKLSGGERQRVAIARALIGDPAIVLADEPTGNLDTKTSESIMALIHDLSRAGSTIVVITHNMEIAADLPRQIALRDGLVEFDSALAGVT